MWVKVRAAALLVRGLARTMRIDVVGEEHLVRLWSTGRPLIYAIWHGQLLMVPLMYERLRRRRGGRPISVLASRSRDGEQLARFLDLFHLDVVRGSSSRGGASAVRHLVAALRAGHDVAIAPDGPRGPRGHARPGVVTLAQLTGASLMPLAFVARPAWALGSWDRFEVPKPFACAVLAFGTPLDVARDADRDLTAKDLEVALEELTAATERRLRAKRRRRGESDR